MTSVRTTFSERLREIDHYFVLLHGMDQGDINLVKTVDGSAAKSRAELADLMKTFKANCFILLYNLVESTLANAIEEIFEEIASSNTSLDDCTANIRRIVLKNLRNRSIDKIEPLLNHVATDIIGSTFRKDELFSGNIDARRVRKVASDYGFAEPTKDSDQLLTVKSYRNDLAHGDKSFSEVGRDFDVPRLLAIKNEVVTYMENLLDNVEDYVNQKAFRVVVTVATSP